MKDKNTLNQLIVETHEAHKSAYHRSLFPAPDSFFHHFRLLETLPASLTSLTDLTFWGSVEHVVEVIRFICSFPLLQDLSVRADRLLFQARELPKTWNSGLYRLPEGLKNLEMTTFISECALARDAWIGWLKSHPAVALDCFALHSCCAEREWTVNFAPFLGLCDMKSLKTLEIDIDDHIRFSEVNDIDALVSRSFNISSLTSLETLKIWIGGILIYRSELCALIRLLGWIISHLSSSSFRKVELRLLYEAKSISALIGPSVGEAWDFLDRTVYILTTSPMVEVIGPAKEWDRNVEEVRELFGRCHRDQRLVVRPY
ncbi:hypothetical protein PM082_012451 [Marasmius tenuissimus]|nr:hypothetical protein PM082_012451 [Marasmius tenuissimus]